LHLISKLVKLIGKGNEIIQAKFEQEIYDNGIDIVNRTSATAVKESKAYIEAIIDVYVRFFKFVDKAVNREQGYMIALDRACSKIINDNVIVQEGQRLTKSSELLARYCDLILHKYIFQKFYGKLLAKRFVDQQSVLDDYEESLISKLKVSKLQRMFQDIRLSTSLMEEYKEYCANKQSTRISDFSVMVLTSNSWRFTVPAIFYLPIEVLKLALDAHVAHLLALQPVYRDHYKNLRYIAGIPAVFIMIAMFPHRFYSTKVIRQRIRHQQQHQAIRRIHSSIDSQSDDSIPFNEQSTNTEPHFFSTSHGSLDYEADEHDNVYINSNDIPDDTPPLFLGSSISTALATDRIMKFSLDANLDKLKSKKLLVLIKSLLPSPNNLPVTHKQVLKRFGRTSMFTTQYYCNHCSNIVSTLKLGAKICLTSDCIGSQRTLNSNELTEVVTVNIISRLESILVRNIEVLTGQTNHLFPPSDLSRFEFYQEVTKNKANENVITLILHSDAAPLVRSNKQSLWPFYTSIAELPPPIREYKHNILTLALWASRVKPDPNIFLDFMLFQLRALIERGTSVFIGNIEYRFVVRIQCFIADLPAKSLLLKTINFNGRNACNYCLSTGQYNNEYRMVLYPYKLNNFKTRTHDDFVRIAKHVATESKRTGKQVCIEGIKGYSILLDVLNYPCSIIFDYMHLVCIGHVPAVIRRWRNYETKDNLTLIDKKLESLCLPHNCHVRFKHPIANVDNWKAKHGRLFVLQVGVPVLIDVIRPIYLAHFSLYSIAITLLHSPRNSAEIELADKLLHYYCSCASSVYDESIELYSLHSHLHLSHQVKLHGGLCFHSAFAFESCIRYTQQRAHGSRNLASQISYWQDMEAIFDRQCTTIGKPICIDEIPLDSKQMDEYREPLHTLLKKYFPSSIESIKLYKRFCLMNNNVYVRPYISTRPCTADIYCLVLFKEDNSYIVKKQTQLPAADKSGLVKIRFQKQIMIGMIIREDECEKAGRGLESAIRTDIESEAEVSHSTQNKLNQRKENQDPSLSSNHTKPATANVCVLPPFSALDVKDLENHQIPSSDSDSSDEIDLIDKMLEELNEINPSKKIVCNKKRKKKNQTAPAAKRLVATNSIVSDDNSTSVSTLNEIYKMLQRIESNCQANKIQLEQLVVEQKRASNIVRLMFDNQKRIQKSFAKLQIHVPLVDPQDEDNEKSDTSNLVPFRKSLEWPIGSSDSVDVLLIPSDPTNKTRYATKVLNIVFSREDLENIQPDALPSDERYHFVKGRI
ncbi:unnamed protein product, partial [Rotaria sp. Silwood2]